MICLLICRICFKIYYLLHLLLTLFYLFFLWFLSVLFINGSISCLIITFWQFLLIQLCLFLINPFRKPLPLKLFLSLFPIISHPHHCHTSHQSPRSLAQHFFAILKSPQFQFLVFTSNNLQLFSSHSLLLFRLYTFITLASCNVNVGLEFSSWMLSHCLNCSSTVRFNWKFPFSDEDEFIAFEVNVVVSFFTSDWAWNLNWLSRKISARAG